MAGGLFGASSKSCTHMRAASICLGRNVQVNPDLWEHINKDNIYHAYVTSPGKENVETRGEVAKKS